MIVLLLYAAAITTLRTCREQLQVLEAEHASQTRHAEYGKERVRSARRYDRNAHAYADNGRSSDSNSSSNSARGSSSKGSETRGQRRDKSIPRLR
jgi:hypothetical protein